MRKLLTVVAIASLCACGQADEPSQEPEATGVAAPDVPDGGPVVGSYSVTAEDGETMSWTNNEDGTYASVMADGSEGSGTYAMAGREYCYDPEGDGEGLEEVCLAFSDAGEDGSWVSTRPDGTQSTVIRVAASDDASEEEAAAE